MSQLSTSSDEGEETQSQFSSKQKIQFLFQGIIVLILLTILGELSYYIFQPQEAKITSSEGNINCPKVTCQFMLDDEVTKVTYQDIDLPFDAKCNSWKDVRTVTFNSCNNHHPGKLAIEGMYSS